MFLMQTIFCEDVSVAIYLRWAVNMLACIGSAFIILINITNMQLNETPLNTKLFLDHYSDERKVKSYFPY
jgi:hypothetical protein